MLVFVWNWAIVTEDNKWSICMVNYSFNFPLYCLFLKFSYLLMMLLLCVLFDDDSIRMGLVSSSSASSSGTSAPREARLLVSRTRRTSILTWTSLAGMRTTQPRFGMSAATRIPATERKLDLMVERKSAQDLLSTISFGPSNFSLAMFFYFTVSSQGPEVLVLG